MYVILNSFEQSKFVSMAKYNTIKKAKTSICLLANDFLLHMTIKYQMSNEAAIKKKYGTSKIINAISTRTKNDSMFPAIIQHHLTA